MQVRTFSVKAFGFFIKGFEFAVELLLGCYDGVFVEIGEAGSHSVLDAGVSVHDGVLGS